MFESLSEKLQSVFKRLRGKGVLSEQDVNEALREVRLVLLEADVNFRVVKDFVARVRERAVGREVLQSLSPAQHVIKIVNEELIELLGGADAGLSFAPKPPTVIMLVGLQGSGKTTTAAKLASLMRKQGRKPLLVAADVYRPAAIKQLQVLGEQIGIPVFSLGDKQDPVNIGKAAVSAAESAGQDVLILDTAGRLHIAAFDQQKAEELERKLRENKFDFEDYLEQLQQMRKMGPLDQLLSMIPGFDARKMQGVEIDEGQIGRVEAIIRSMTKEERHNPGILNGSRRRRIAQGSGTSV
ncbi:MAG: signal recognition particle receptor subunit alpha, partial [Armatimonadetes bacterium]|nr:signal recognition particle receptor subunit alpha [Armatimonadota bacterium]